MKKRTGSEKGDTKKHEKGESKSFEKGEMDRKSKKRPTPGRGNTAKPAANDNTRRVGPLATQNVIVSPAQKLKRAMTRLAHGK